MGSRPDPLMPFLWVVLGCLFTPFANAERIISIGGSVTEIIFALDAAEGLVARDTSSTYPMAALSLPDIGYMRTLAAEPIVAMAPSLVIFDEGAGPPGTLSKLKNAKIKLAPVTKDPSFEGALKRIRLIATLLNRASAGDQLIAELKRTSSKLQDSINSAQPRVLFVLSFDPGSALSAGADTAANAMISLAGGENVIAKFRGYKPVGGETINQLAPDFIITTHRAVSQIGSLEKIQRLPVLASLPTKTLDNIVAMDSLLLLGLGPRTVSATKQLAAAIHTID